MDVANAVFRMVGGDPAVNFANTASWYLTGTTRGRDPLDRIGKERLVVGGDLVRWGVAAGVLPRGTEPGDPSTAMLHRARRLRLAMYHLFRARVEGWPADREDLAVLDAEAREARNAQRLAAQGKEWHWAWLDAPSPEVQVLRSVASAAATLLTSERAEDLKQCAGDDCGWLFVDTSRNHKRRWCEMADCGNLAKVRRFRKRQGRQE